MILSQAERDFLPLGFIVVENRQQFQSPEKISGETLDFSIGI